MNSSDENQKPTRPNSCSLRFSLREMLLIFVIVSLGFTLYTRREEWNSEVIRLFSLDDRDDAIKKLLGNPPKFPIKILDVVSCPQQDKPPLIAVTAIHGNSPKTWMYVFRVDGTDLKWRPGFNPTNNNELRDLTGDGVIDWYETVTLPGPLGKYGEFTMLHVMPIEEPFETTFSVGWKPGLIDCRVTNLIVGKPKIHLVRGWDVVAEYSWSTYHERWEGPSTTKEIKRGASQSRWRLRVPLREEEEVTRS